MKRVAVFPALVALGSALAGLGRWQEPPGVQFVDVTARAGLNAPNVFGGVEKKKYILESTGCGAAFFDYDRDGLLDILLVNGTTLDQPRSTKRPAHYLFRNSGNGTFIDVAEKAGLQRSGWGQGVCVGDYNNDDRDDLLVTYYGHDVLYRNEGSGKFTDVTAQAKLPTTGTRWGAGCAFLDYDNDGWLDAFVANYVDFEMKTAPLPGSRSGQCQWKGIPVFCGPTGLKGAQNILYRNNRDGTFTDVSQRARILKGSAAFYSLGVAASDFDNDGWIDIYVACDSTANILYRNNRDGTFSDIALEGGVAYNEDGRAQAGMGIGVADYDRNSFFDIFVTNFSDDTSTLYQNNGDGTFTDRTLRAQLGLNTRFLGWGNGFIDYDNDGWRDIFVANGHVYPEIDAHSMDTGYHQRKLLYRNLGDGTFKDVSLETGPGLLSRKAARGAAFGDFDNDGDVDALVNNMNDLPSLLLNEGGNRKRWLMVQAIGTQSNRSAIGARISIFYGKEHQTEEIRSGGSWASHSDLRVHFGLGSANKVDRLEVRWPSGLTETLRDIAANRVVVLREGELQRSGN